jgi:hypothetical protein
MYSVTVPFIKEFSTWKLARSLWANTCRLSCSEQLRRSALAQRCSSSGAFRFTKDWRTNLLQS